MATAEEIKILSKEVNNLTGTIVAVSNTANINQTHFKAFIRAEREELSTSIDAAANKLDKSSKASFWLTLAIAFFACVEAGSIFYDVALSRSNQQTTDCVAIAESLFGETKHADLPKHEQNIALFLRQHTDDYTSAFAACGKIDKH